MKEILFKAKRLDNGKWIQGGLVHQTDCYGDKVDKWFIIDGTTTQDYDIGENIEVNPKTICQYTGFVGTDGVKISSGDTAKADDKFSKTAVVRTLDFYLNGDNQLLPLMTVGGYGIYGVNKIEMAKELKVVGNIYDKEE